MHQIAFAERVGQITRAAQREFRSLLDDPSLDELQRRCVLDLIESLARAAYRVARDVR